MTYQRYVAIGDSLTEGKGDPLPDGRLRGFADLLAGSLAALDPEMGYANLARPSVRAHEVLAEQVPAALTLRPQLVTAICGVNDVIGVRFDAARVGATLMTLFGALRSHAPPGCRLLTATLPDLRGVSRLARFAAGRVARLNEATLAAAARHDVLVVRLDELPISRPELAIDRVHPSPLGHLMIASTMSQALGVPAPQVDCLAPRPSAEALHRLWRTAVVAPRFVTRRVARKRLIAAQPPKRGTLQPVEAQPAADVAPLGRTGRALLPSTQEPESRLANMYRG